MKRNKILIIVVVILVLGTIGLFLEDEDKDKPKEKAEVSSNLDVTDVELLKKEGHPRLADKDKTIETFYKGDDRVYELGEFNAAQERNEGEGRQKLLLFICDSAHIDGIEITAKHTKEKIDLDEALSIAETYLPSDMNNYKFIKSGIEKLDESQERYCVLYESINDEARWLNLGVFINMKDNNLVKIEMMGYVSDFEEIKSKLTESWDYRFKTE